MIHRVVIDQLVDGRCRHTLFDLLGHQIQHTGIDHTTATDALDLFRCLDQLTGRHQMPVVLHIQYFLV